MVGECAIHLWSVLATAQQCCSQRYRYAQTIGLAADAADVAGVGESGEGKLDGSLGIDPTASIRLVGRDEVANVLSVVIHQQQCGDRRDGQTVATEHCPLLLQGLAQSFIAPVGRVDIIRKVCQCRGNCGTGGRGR